MNPVLVNDGKGINFSLDTSNFTAEVTHSPYANGSVFIPKNINYLNQYYKVTTIQKKSFNFNINIKSVSFPKDSELLVIEEEAFAVSSLESIQIPSSVISIEKKAFCNCNNLISVDIPADSKLSVISKSLFSFSLIKNLNIPSSVVRIEKKAFLCSKLETLNIPNDSKLISIGKYAFSSSNIKSLFIPPLVEILEDEWCHETLKLNNILISPNNKNFSIIDNNIVVSKSDLNQRNYDALCFAIRSIESALIPSFIKTIQSFAFSYCTKLSTVTFSSDSELRTIKKGAFIEAAIKSIVIPNKVSVIEACAFESCSRLENFQFPNNKQYKIIDQSLLRGASIKKVFIPSSVTRINFRAFSDCKDIKSITFPPNTKLKQIENYAFYYNYRLNKISIPLSVKEIGACAFVGCSNLKSINLPLNLPMKSITPLMFFATGLESAIIPFKVSKVQNEAFALCNKLKTLEFLSDSINIDELAFNESDNLFLVSFPNAKKIEFDSSAFDQVSEDIHIFTVQQVKIKIITT